MKKGTLTNYFRFTLGGDLAWYTIKVRNWDYSPDEADVRVLEKIHDSAERKSDMTGHIFKIDKEEIWTMEKMIKHKKMLFRMMFEVLGK